MNCRTRQEADQFGASRLAADVQQFMALAVLVDGMPRFGHFVRRQTGAGRRNTVGATDGRDGISDVDVKLLRFEQQLQEQAARETSQ